MRFPILAAMLLITACAPRPAPQPVPPASSGAADSSGHDHRTLTGMTANELVEHFGKPRLQIKEGDGTKLQFMGKNCVLDAYLYPSGNGPAGMSRVTHMEARNFQGVGVDTQSCVYAIEKR